MPRKDPVRDVREKKTVLLDVNSNRVFQILASDEFARFLSQLVVQTEDNNQSLSTKELINVQ